MAFQFAMWGKCALFSRQTPGMAWRLTLPLAGRLHYKNSHRLRRGYLP